MSANKGEEFKPGQKCKQSGIYSVVHDENHTQPHEVTCVNGHTFPPCNHCGKGVKFVLTHPAVHIDKSKWLE
jgi:hypothetical protein